MRQKWPDEVVEWLRKTVPGRTTKEVTALINKQGFSEKYGIVFTESVIKGAKARYKIQSGTPCGVSKGTPSSAFPEEVREFISANYEGTGPTEMTSLVNEKLQRSYTVGQIKSYYKNHGLHSGLDGRFQKGHVPDNKGKKISREQYEKIRGTMFKKGNIPFNKLCVGEYTHTTDGYLIRKVSDTGNQWERFELVHRSTWEQHCGPIPPGKMVSFLDGDKDNCDIENLVLIDNDENLELNRSRLRFSEAEYTKSGLAIVKVKIAARRKKKGASSHDGKRVKPEPGSSGKQ